MTSPSPAPLYCANHPNVETSLRCNRCDKPICSKCAVLTPTGYRCRECVRSQQKTFDTAQWWDLPVALVIAGVLSCAGSLLTSFLGFFTVLIAPVVGTIIAEVVRFCVQRRRSKALFKVTAAGVILGCLPLVLIKLLPIFMLLGSNPAMAGGGLLSLLWPVLYLILAASSAYARLSGIQIK